MRFATFALSTLVANAAAGVIAPRAPIDYSGVDWTKVDYSGVDWTKVDYSGGNKNKENEKKPDPVQKAPEPSVAPVTTSVVSVPTTVAAVPTTVAAAVAAPTTLVTKVATSSAAAAPTQSSTPSQPSNGNLSDDQQKALDAHNAARAAVGNSPLTWDSSLASDAQSWANTIASASTLKHSSGSGQGENLYVQSNNESPYLNSINSFLSEKSLYSGQAIDGSNFASFGHYTQAVWKTTTKVGMAVAKAADGSNYVVVRYSPAGNYIGEKPY